MVVLVRFFADWFAELPSWSDDGRDAEDLVRDESFPADLIDRLRGWCAEFNEQPHGELLSERPPEREWFADYDKRGRALADEVATHLGPGFVIEYKPLLSGGR